MDPMTILQMLGGMGGSVGPKFGKAGALGSLMGMGMKDANGNKQDFGTNGMATKGQAINAALGSGLELATSAISNFGGIKNSAMNKDQKNMAYADSGVDMAADVASQFGPVGQGIGMGLKLVNSVGGALIGTPKAMKDFNVNDTVGASTGFGGVVDSANSVKDSTTSYQTAGLAGKLVGRKSITNGMNKSNMMQNQVSGMLNTNKMAMNSAVASQDMFSMKNQNKLNNTSMWNNGSVMMGQSGGTLNTSGSNVTKTTEAYKKLGKASKSINVKKIGKSVTKHQQGGKFEQWYKAVAQHKGLDPNPYAKEHYYDYKMFFEKEPQLAKRLLTDDPEAHFTDIGKLPGHPTFSDESAYFNESNKKQAGYWNGDIYMPFDDKKGALDTKTGKHIPPVVKFQDVISHKDGGAINVIVDGKLHAHKHDLKDVEELADAPITLKGVPVVSIDEEGGVIQHAEVERDELILHLELTQKLEKLLEEGTEEAMIKAGKLLSKEIVKNTRDSKSKILKDVEVDS